MEELDQLDKDYTAKKASYDNLPTFKRDMKERYEQVWVYFMSFVAFNRGQWCVGDRSTWAIERTLV